MGKMIFVAAASQSYEVREATLEGRAHLVVPVVIMVEGVHNGSGGRVLYLAEELAAFVEAWNGVPLPVQHPYDRAGNPISANSPDVIEAQCVGRLFNVSSDSSGAKVRGEFWIDVEKAAEVSPDVLAIINAREPLEVSTGMMFELDATPGTWHGGEYTGIARNLRPDHVALLPGGIGACSMADGCGVRANQQLSLEDGMTKPNTPELPLPAPAPVTNTEPPAAPPPATPSAQEQTMGTLKALKAAGFAWTVNVDVSHDSIRGKLQQIVNGFDNDQWLNWVRTVFDDRFIYEVRGHNPATGGYSYHLYQRGYTIDDVGVVTVGNEVTEVIEETVYTPIPEVTSNQRKEKDIMSKDKIDALIANTATKFVECDRPWLTTLSEAQLDKLTPEAAAPAAPPPVVNSRPDPKTAEEYAAAAPEAIKPILVNALAAQRAAKDALVAGIIANARNKFTKEQLEAKDATELTTLSGMLEINIDYSGKGGGAPSTVANGVPVLETPDSTPKPQSKAA